MKTMKIAILWWAFGITILLVGCEKLDADAPQVDTEPEALAPILPCMSWDGDVCKPVLFKLLADPSIYSGTTVEVMGYGVWGERSLVVYPSVDMACSQTVTAGIELDHAIEVPDAGTKALANNGVVSIIASGVFNADMTGLSARYIGHLDDAKIVQIDYARSSLKVDPRILSREPDPGNSDLSEMARPICK